MHASYSSLVLAITLFSFVIVFTDARNSVVVHQEGGGESCVIQNGMVTDNGQTRPLTSAERDQLSRYRAEWKEWSSRKFGDGFPFTKTASSSSSAEDTTSSSRNRGAKPKFPCICSGCTQPSSTDDPASSANVAVQGQGNKVTISQSFAPSQQEPMVQRAKRGCADSLCSHPCSVSPTACNNCHNIDVPAQCGGGGGGSGGGGNGKSSVILVHGNHNEIVTSQRGKRGLASDINTEIRTDIRKNVAEIGTVTGDKNEVAIQQSFAPQQSTLRAKRGLAADINTEIRTDIRKNVATIGTVTGDKNEVAIKQS